MLTGYKTIIASVIAMVIAVVSWVVGALPGDQAFLAVWGLLVVVFARLGIDIKSGGWLTGYKTYATAVIGVLTAVGAWIQGSMSPKEAIMAAITAVLAIFFRAGIGRATA